MAALRVLVVGSDRCAQNPQDKALIHAAGEELGRRLAERGHVVLVGSEDPDDVDPDVVRGALSTAKSAVIEVHVMQGAKACYAGSDFAGRIKTWPHRYRDWDVTVLEVLRRSADAVVAIGGRVGVVQSGIAGWMLGRAVVPIASFDGGGATVWGYASGERREFYFGALTDEEIDRLQSSWVSGGESAMFVVDALERVAIRAKRAKTPKGVFVFVSVLVLVALVSWVALLALPLVGCVPGFPSSGASAPDPAALPAQRFILLLVSVCAAGALGALMQTLRGIRDDRPATPSRILIDLVLGTAAGFLTAALYLIAQIALTGKLELPATDLDYVRVALTVGLAALFASLYLDAALARFDSLKDSVIAGKYGATAKEKP